MADEDRFEGERAAGEAALAEPVKGIHSEIAAVRLEQQAIEKRRRPIELLTLGMLIITAFFTAGTYIVFNEQLNTFKDQLNATNRAIDTSHSDAQKALVVGSRPWVGVSSASIDPITADHNVIARITVQNFGHSPAFNVRYRDEMGVMHTANGTLPVPTHEQLYPSADTLFPGSSSNPDGIVFHVGPITQTYVDSIQSGAMVVWIAGRIEYTDSDGKEHLTTYKYQYLPSERSLVAAANGNTAN